MTTTTVDVKAPVRPRWSSPRLYRGTVGPGKVRWAEDNLTTLKGPRAGKPLRFLKWERLVVEDLHEVDPDGHQRYRTGLIGVGRQNGKSIIGSALAAEALFRGPPGSEVYSAAGDKKQARIVFGETRKQVLKSRRLSRLATVYRDAIEIPSTGNVYRVLSADAKLQQGLSPYFVVFDEVHVQRDDELWNAMEFGMAARPEAMMIGITTAGDHEDSPCGRLYEYGKAIAEGEVVDPTFFFAWWEPHRYDCDLLDREAWVQANPALVEGTLDFDEMETAARRSRPEAFRRYRLNQWVSHGGDRWMDMSAWDDCENPNLTLAKRSPVAVTFDGSVDEDATVLSVTRLDLDVPALAASFVWERSQTDPEDWKVNRAEVDAVVETLFADYDVRVMFCDPAYWRSEIEGWQDRFGGRKVLEWPVTDSRMGPAVTETYKRVKEGDFMHVGDPTVRRHVRNAVTKPTRGAQHVTIRKQTPKSSHKIDAAVTVVMGVDAWTRYARKRNTMRSL